LGKNESTVEFVLRVFALANGLICLRFCFGSKFFEEQGHQQRNPEEEITYG
jgi:hypothetical protein